MSDEDDLLIEDVVTTLVTGPSNEDDDGSVPEEIEDVQEDGPPPEDEEQSPPSSPPVEIEDVVEEQSEGEECHEEASEDDDVDMADMIVEDVPAPAEEQDDDDETKTPAPSPVYDEVEEEDASSEDVFSDAPPRVVDSTHDPKLLAPGTHVRTHLALELSDSDEDENGDGDGDGDARSTVAASTRAIPAATVLEQKRDEFLMEVLIRQIRIAGETIRQYAMLSPSTMLATKPGSITATTLDVSPLEHEERLLREAVPFESPVRPGLVLYPRECMKGSLCAAMTRKLEGFTDEVPGCRLIEYMTVPEADVFFRTGRLPARAPIQCVLCLRVLHTEFQLAMTNYGIDVEQVPAFFRNETGPGQYNPDYMLNPIAGPLTSVPMPVLRWDHAAYKAYEVPNQHASAASASSAGKRAATAWVIDQSRMHFRSGAASTAVPRALP